MAITPSFQDIVDVGQAEAQSRRPDLTFNDGDVSEAFCHAGAVMAESVLSSLLQQVADTYFGLAEGDALDTVIEDKTGITRKASDYATTELHFERLGTGTAGTIQAGALIATEPDDTGKQIVFVLQTSVIVPDTIFSAYAQAQAQDVGADGNVQVGSLTVWKTQPFDTTITVTNGEAAGGRDAESDDDYRRRGATAWITQRRGTLAALEQGAMSVSGVASAKATEDTDTGLVTVNIADQSGGSNAKLIYDVTKELENWRAGGIVATVIGGHAAVIDLDIVIAESADGFDVSSASSAIIASVTRLLNDLRRGETAYLDAVKAAVISPYSESIKKVRFARIRSTTLGVTTDLSTTDDIVRPDMAIKAGTITVS